MTETSDRLTAALQDRYRIERELGAGGMATVYLARDVRHAREVAVKVLKPQLAATLGPERFLREIQVAARLQHPHILPVHDSGEADGFLFYVMPYVRGESLRERLAREGELPIAEAVAILHDVVDALAHAHEQGVVHRDIKPDNIMLSGRHALVMDFGVAKAVSEATGRQQLTTAGVALGTPAYMAPEQATADPAMDHRADIYAVGAVAYELLTGRPPFTGVTPQKILAAHVTEPAEPVTKHRERVSPELNALVMHCLEKKPADRWQSADELLSQLEGVMTPSGGVTPMGVTPVGRRRNRRAGLAGVMAIGVALLVGGFFVLRDGSGPAAPAPADLRQLTANPLSTALTGAAISPDGTFLAWVDPTGLYIQTVGTGEVTARTLPDSLVAWDVGWFPDGSRLFLLATSRRGRLDLLTLPLLGGSPVRVMDSVLRAAVAPDGSVFAVIRAGREGGSQYGALWTVGVRGEAPEVVMRADSGDSFWDVGWSPDSRRIAVGVWGRGDLAIRTVKVGDPQQSTLVSDSLLFQNWTGVLPFTWCGDGRLIFARRDGPAVEATSNIWTIETDVERGTPIGEPRRVTQLVGSNVRRLSATADCQSAVAMLVKNQADVWVAELGPTATTLGEEVQVTVDERSDRPVTWVGKDDLIVASWRSGAYNLFRWTPGTSGVTPFTVGDGSSDDGAWAPSVERFLYQGGGLWSFGRDGGVGIRISDRTFDQIECSAGGCVAGRRNGEEFVFSSVDVRSGEVEELTRIADRPPFVEFALSPDGQTAAVVHNDNNRIRLVDLRSGRETQVEVEEWAHFEFVSWSADGTRILVNAGFAASGLYPALLSVGLDGTVRLLRQSPNVWHVRPEVSPDGRHVAFGAMPFQGNAWLLTGF